MQKTRWRVQELRTALRIVAALNEGAWRSERGRAAAVHHLCSIATLRSNLGPRLPAPGKAVDNLWVSGCSSSSSGRSSAAACTSAPEQWLKGRVDMSRVAAAGAPPAAVHSLHVTEHLVARLHTDQS